MNQDTLTNSVLNAVKESRKHGLAYQDGIAYFYRSFANSVSAITITVNGRKVRVSL